MKQIYLALPLGFLAFWSTALLTAGIFGTTHLSLLAACTAAYLTWRHFAYEDTRDLAAALAPRQLTVPLPYATAYGCVKESLALSKMLLNGTLYSWHLEKDDAETGTLIATLSLREQVTQNAHPLTIHTNLTAYFSLTALPTSTHLQYSFTAHCPSGHHRAKQAIAILDDALTLTTAREAQASAVCCS